MLTAVSALDPGVLDICVMIIFLLRNLQDNNSER